MQVCVRDGWVINPAAITVVKTTNVTGDVIHNIFVTDISGEKHIVEKRFSTKDEAIEYVKGLIEVEDE